MAQQADPSATRSSDAAPSTAPDRFIVLSEFQVWADAASPEVFKELSRLYHEKGRSHLFDLYPRFELFVWDAARMRHWVDEAKALGCFNLFCLGDDTRTAQGHLFDNEGVNPKLKDFLFATVAYAHQQGFLVPVEPTHLPPRRTREAFVPWLKSWLGPQVPAESRVDIVKLSIEWFGAWQLNPEIAVEVEAFFEALKEVSPATLVYLDSISGIWRTPQPFHRWLLKRFPGTILSHYLNTDQIPAFRAIGARNLMVQVNPSETFEAAGQFFIYHDFTVRLLKDVVAQRLRFVSLAGVNFGYNRYNYELFLDIIRPHLKLARSVAELRASLQPETIQDAPTAEDVARSLVELQRKRAEAKQAVAAPIPLNAAGRPAFFAETPDGWLVGLEKIGDRRSGAKFEGAYTEPVRRRPVRATFGLDFGVRRKISRLTVVPCLAESGSEYVAREFRIECRVGEEWKTVPGAEWSNNLERKVNVILKEALTTDAIRLRILSQSDDGQGNYRACCQELEATETNRSQTTEE
jgi:hypothetical protein